MGDQIRFRLRGLCRPREEVAADQDCPVAGVLLRGRMPFGGRFWTTERGLATELETSLLFISVGP